MVKSWYCNDSCDASATPKTGQDFDHVTDNSTSFPVAGSTVCLSDVEPCNHQSTSGTCGISISDNGMSQSHNFDIVTHESST